MLDKGPSRTCAMRWAPCGAGEAPLLSAFKSIICTGRGGPGSPPPPQLSIVKGPNKVPDTMLAWVTTVK